MSRRKVMLVVALIISGLGVPAASSANGPHAVSGLGTQVIVQPATATTPSVTIVRNFAISALSNSSGTALGLGLFDIRRTDGNNKSFLMSIECVAVEGKQAVLIGTVLWSTAPQELGIPVFFGVEDTVEGRKQKKPDRLTIVLGFIVGDQFTPDYTQEQLCDLAVDGELTPINFGVDLRLGFDLPLIDVAIGNIGVK